MPSDSRYIQIAFSIQKMLESSGVLDQKELEALVSMALTDGVVDEDERRILKLIFRQLKEKDVAPGVWEKIQQLVKQYGL